MEKLVQNDGMYKVVYKLPSQSVLEFDISLKSKENFESVLVENFEQEQVPKILLNDIFIIFQHFLNEEKRSVKTYSIKQKDFDSTKKFLDNRINQYLTIQNFKNHIQLNSINAKHSMSHWQKLTILKFYNYLEGVKKIDLKVKEYYTSEKEKLTEMEINMQMKQEKEMQDANLKNYDNDQIEELVNKHITEFQKISDEFELRLVENVVKLGKEFHDKIDQNFLEFFEKIEQNQLIYNIENRLIKLKISNLNLEKKSLINEFDGCEIVNNKIKYMNEIFMLSNKLSLGAFNRINLYFYTYISDDLLKNNLQKLFKFYEKNRMLKNKGKIITDSTDDYTLNDIYKSDDRFGGIIFSCLNFFTFNSENNSIEHTMSGLNSVEYFINELFFKNHKVFFEKIKNLIVNNNIPSSRDIFITKHSNISPNLVIHSFLKKFYLVEDEIEKLFEKLIYFLNNYEVNILIIPVHSLIEKLFENKYNDLRGLTKILKILTITLKKILSKISKSGIHIFTKHFIFHFPKFFLSTLGGVKNENETLDKINSVIKELL